MRKRVVCAACCRRNWFPPSDPARPEPSHYMYVPLVPASETIRSYLRQCREETGRRLIDRLYAAGAGGTSGDAGAAALPNKHWLAFSNRRFMDRAL